jgi:hypothetical protein
MKVAIMQPYFLPYIGYFQLMGAVDKFILLDSANYIKGGWINRNRLLLSGTAHTFTIPLQYASQNKLICQSEIAPDEKWGAAFLKKISYAYAKAPHYSAVKKIIESIVCHDETRLEAFIANSLSCVARYIGLTTDLVPTSQHYGSATLKGQERIIGICREEGAQQYVNSEGGRSLYKREAFYDQGIDLKFLSSTPTEYDQGLLANTPFVPNLSILDVLMFNDPPEIRRMLESYRLT